MDIPALKPKAHFLLNLESKLIPKMFDAPSNSAYMFLGDKLYELLHVVLESVSSETKVIDGVWSSACEVIASCASMSDARQETMHAKAMSL